MTTANRWRCYPPEVTRSPAADHARTMTTTTPSPKEHL